MASLEQRADRFRIVFRFGGQKFTRSLKTSSRSAASLALARVEDNLRRLELGTLSLPDGADIASFILSDGKLNGSPQVPPPCLLFQLLDGYLESLPAGGLEQSTLECVNIHIRHLKRSLGERFSVRALELSDLQAYVDERAKAIGRHGRKVSATTIKKEIVTFAAAWGWARHQGIVNREFPKRSLRYPKTTEKPPFQTYQEIERKVKRGGLTAAEEADLWDCAFLTVPDIAQLLQFVKEKARLPFLYPMFVFAAHTGARRSEIIRSTVDDLDFTSNTVTIHEKKRVRGKLTTRWVPMSPILAETLRGFLAQHSGGPHRFCHPPKVDGNRSCYCHLSRDEVHDHFRRTVAGSKWEKLRGWHVFRHSFCSNAAAAGVDQRMINA